MRGKAALKEAQEAKKAADKAAKAAAAQALADRNKAAADAAAKKAAEAKLAQQRRLAAKPKPKSSKAARQWLAAVKAVREAWQTPSRRGGLVHRRRPRLPGEQTGNQPGRALGGFRGSSHSLLA